MKRSLGVFIGTAWLAVATAAGAHVAVSSGPATAGKSQLVTFGVGHGCTGSDTFTVRMEIPAGVTAIRPLRSDFGAVSVEKNLAGEVVAVIWQKDNQDLLDEDVSYYELKLRLRTPDQPFTTLYFPTHQTCKSSTGTLSTSEWTALPGQAGEPAPSLVLMPARHLGWNKYTVPAALSDLAAYFSDAAIVWRGMSAFSPNPEVAALIPTTSGVSTLSTLEANDEIWVKY